MHRDLKPANIKLRPDGMVKVLDFGLAKLAQPSDPGLQASDLSQSPTVTSPAATRAGIILGTAAYMSPEQARGKPLDKRADIWAFGCVLYEMLTGKRAFAGDEVTDTLAAILRGEPDWNVLPPSTPALIRRLLRRCVEKDPRERLHDISDARLDIKEALASGAGTRSRISDADTSASGLATRCDAGRRLARREHVAGITVWLTTRPAPPRVARLMITPQGPATLAVNGFDRDVAISPDGTRLVYVGGNGSQLFVRPLDRMEPTPLEGLGVPHHPFFSPDGSWVGFFDGIGALKKVSINGGPSVTVCRVSGAPYGASWGPDGILVQPRTGGASARVLLPPGRALLAGGGWRWNCGTADQGLIRSVSLHDIP